LWKTYNKENGEVRAWDQARIFFMFFRGKWGGIGRRKMGLWGIFSIFQKKFLKNAIFFRSKS
jgi:hypothetical protein